MLALNYGSGTNGRSSCARPFGFAQGKLPRACPELVEGAAVPTSEPFRHSLVAQGFDGIDLGRAPRGEVAS
jgi:hypothetical protein